MALCPISVNAQLLGKEIRDRAFWGIGAGKAAVAGSAGALAAKRFEEPVTAAKQRPGIGNIERKRGGDAESDKRHG